MYLYKAALYCDDCGREIIASLERDIERGFKRYPNYPEPWDSDDWPQWASEDQETDYPDFCAAGSECLNAVDLGMFGLNPDDPLFGAETRLVGVTLGERLTSDGVQYLRESVEVLELDNSTPYQKALAQLYRESYSEYF